MFCSTCGSKIPADSNTCPNCTPISVSKDTASTSRIDSDEIVITLDNDSSVSLIKTNQKGFSFLILAMFLLNGSFLFKSIILKLSSKPLPMIWTPITSILCWFLGGIFILLYFKKTTDIGFDLKNLKRVLASSILSIILAISFISIFGLIISNMYKTVVSLALNESALGLVLVLVYFILVLIVQFFILSTILQLYVSIKNGIHLIDYAKIYLSTLSIMFKNFLKIFMINIVAALLFVIMLILQDLILNAIDSLQPYGFLTVFFNALVWSIIFAYIIQLAFNFGDKYIKAPLETTSDKKIFSFRSLLILLSIALVPIFFLAITTKKPSSDPYDRLIQEIRSEVAKGDLIMDLGISLGAIEQYDKALSTAYSLRGLLIYEKSLKTSNSQLRSDASNDFNYAQQLNIYNGYISLFKGNMLLLEERYPDALNEFNKGIKNSFNEPEIYLGILISQNKSINKKENINTIDWLMRNEIYHDSFSKIYDLSIKKLEKYLTEINMLIEEIEPKLAYKYYEMTKYNDHTTAFNKLLDLKSKYPKDPQISYFLTLIYSEHRKETGNYDNLTNEVDHLSSLISKSLELDIYKAQMYMQSNKYPEAESFYADLYERESDDLEIGESYVYLLIKNQKFDEAIKVTDDLRSEKIWSLRLTYLNAMALLNLQKHEGSLDTAVEMLEFGDEYTEEYDRFLYSYSLAYVNAIKVQEHIDILETKLNCSILYNYIYGMKGWKDKDSNSSNQYLLLVEKEDERLGYTKYAIAINYYEKAIRTDSKEFDEALEYYLDSIKILPDHAEAYFSLGHCYKQADMKLEALRAFRKVLELIPYEDHRLDPYGIVVHAQGEVSTLTNELSKEVY